MRSRKFILFISMMLLLAFCGSACAAIPTVCQNMDAEKMVRNVIGRTAAQTGSSTGGGYVDTGVSAIYGDNKWIVSCAVSYGIQNIDGAIKVLKEDGVADVLAQKIGSGAVKGSKKAGKGNIMIQQGTNNAAQQKADQQEAAEAIDAMISSFESLENSPIFKRSVFERTYEIGLYLLCFTFLVSLSVKLYGMFIGKNGGEPIDLFFFFIRLVTLIALMTFMRPLCFWGMELSTTIANMLLNQPITSTIMSGALYTQGKYAGIVGSSAYSPWLGANARVSSAYGAADYNRSYAGGHRGIDYAVGSGTPLYAPYDGKIRAKEDNKPGGFGLYVMLTPTDAVNPLGYEIVHRAGHLESVVDKLKNAKGSYIAVDVKKGELIGYTGNSGIPAGGGSYSPHLHADVRLGGGLFSQGDHINPAMVYDYHDGTIPDLSGNYSNSNINNKNPSGSTQSTGTTPQSTGQGSYTVSGQDSISMNMLFNELLLMKWATTNLGASILDVWTVFKAGWGYLGGVILGNLARWFADVVLMVLIVISDVLMALTLALGPLVIALSLLPQFESFLHNWIKGYITFLFYQPLASCFQILSMVMLIVTLDTGITPFLLLCICYVGACMKIPNIADGLSTSAVMGVASMLAFAPALLAMKGAAGITGMGVMAGVNKAMAASGLGGGGDGKIKKKLVVLIAVLGILMTACSSYAAITMSPDEKKRILDVGEEQKYPPQQMLDKIQQTQWEKTVTYVNDVGEFVRGRSLVDDKDPSVGIYNTSYSNAIDTPMVKYVLGSGKLNIANMYQALGFRRHGERIQIVLEEAQKSIRDLLMLQVPVYILFLMFFLQLVCIGYLKFTNEESIGDRINFLSTVPRLVLYLLMILVFPYVVSAAITISNYISNAIVPIESQTMLMSNISSKPAAVVPGSVTGEAFDSFVVWICRALTYLAIKILLIARDMFLTVSIIVGPICIALGYFTRYRDPDYVHQFLSGWLESFIKILFWGPLAAIMLFCLGTLSVLTSMDLLSHMAIVITGLAFVYAAGNLPNMAEKMSSVAVLGLMTAMSSKLLTGLGLGLRGGILGAGMAGGLGINFMLAKGYGQAGKGLLGGLGTAFGVMRNLGMGKNLRNKFEKEYGAKNGGSGGGPKWKPTQTSTHTPDGTGGYSAGKTKQINPNGSNGVPMPESGTGQGGEGNGKSTPVSTGSFVNQKTDSNFNAILDALIAGASVGALAAKDIKQNTSGVMMKSSVTGQLISLNIDKNSLLGASASILHTMNTNGDMDAIRNALATGNMTAFLFGDGKNEGLFDTKDFAAKLGIDKSREIVQNASLGFSVLAIASHWGQKMNERYGDAGFDSKSMESMLVDAQNGIQTALVNFNDGKITETEANEAIGDYINAVSTTMDANINSVMKHENINSVSIPQAPTFGVGYHSGPVNGTLIGIFTASKDASDGMDKDNKDAFTNNFINNNLYEAVMGDTGLINNNSFMESSGLNHENGCVAAMTVGMTGLNFAHEYTTQMYDNNKISAAAYQNAIHQITDAGYRINTLMNDYSAGNLNMSEAQVRESVSTMINDVSITLNAFGPVPTDWRDEKGNDANNTQDSTSPKINRVEKITRMIESMGSASGLERNIERNIQQLKNLTQDSGVGETPHVKSSANDMLR